MDEQPNSSEIEEGDEAAEQCFCTAKELVYSGERITEEMGVHEAWYKEAREQTMETLPAFLEKLTTAYVHDYGTICHAISSAAIGAAWAVEHAPQGGITGFQAGAIMWEFIQHWMSYEGQPLRLVRFEDMLYPQYQDRFTTISQSTWEWLQAKAQERLAEANGCGAHATVLLHWQSIADGVVPFGYQLG